MMKSKVEEKFEAHLMAIIERVEAERVVCGDIKEIEKMHAVLYGCLKSYQLVEGVGTGRINVLETLENTIIFLVQYTEDKQALLEISELREILITLDGFLAMYATRNK